MGARTVARVAAVQWARQPFHSIEALESALQTPLAEAAQAGAELVVFSGGVGDVLRQTLRCAEAAPELQAAFEALGCRLAAAYGVTLALGPVLAPSAGGAQRLACLFGPDGTLLGRQIQTHRNAADQAAGLAAGTELALLATPLGPVGLVVGADVTYPEVGRILCMQGAAILLHQDALPRWSDGLALSRLWREVQANQVFGVEAYAVGEGCRGRSAIHAPVEMVPDGSGWLARAPDDERPAVVTAELDSCHLRKVVEAYPIHRLRNCAQYRRYFPAIYDVGAARGLGRGDLGRSSSGEAAHEPPLQTRVLSAALSPWLRRRSRPALVQAALDDLPYPRPGPGGPRAASTPARIAAVQFDISLTSSAAAYARHAYEMVRQAVEGGASLVVFPEYATLPLLGLVPGAMRLAAALDRRPGHAAAEESAGGDEGAAADLFGLMLRLVATAASRVHRATFAGLAARFGVTIVAGTAIELGDDKRLHDAGYLYAPDGRVLVRQDKTHLVPVEVAMGYGVGEEISVADTPSGRLAFPVCMDHTYFETARIAALSGCDLLIDPSANIGYYNPYAQARGVWNRVQEVQAYGVLSSGVGHVAGLVFEGCSGVFAPLAMTPAGDGVIAQARTADQEEVVFADLDYAALHAYQAQDPLEFNLALYHRSLHVGQAFEPVRFAPA